jgi:acetyl esterase/lipase
MKKFILSLTLVLLTAAVLSGIVISNTSVSNAAKKDPAVSGIKTIVSKASSQNYVSLTPNIEYANVDGVSLKLHVLKPRDIPKDAKLPLIVYIQGSAWGWDPFANNRAGAPKPQDTTANIPQLSEFAKKGYVVVSVQHRISAEKKFPAQIQDVKTAIKYLKGNATTYSIDPNKVGVWGDSSGGHLANLVGTTDGIAEFEVVTKNERLEAEDKKNNTNKSKARDELLSKQSSKVQAVVDWYGPTDFLKMQEHMLPDLNFDHNLLSSPESQLIGGLIQENVEKVQKANPINYITKDDPPFLIMHGDKDPVVPYNQSLIFYEAFKKAKHDVTMYTVKGAGHGTGFAQANIYDTVTKFFDKQLKK